MSESLTIEHKQGAAWVTLNRPEVGNAINIDLANRLREAAIDLDYDVNVRCVVLSGSGSMFCVGGDLREFADSKYPDKYLAKLAGDLHSALSHLTRMKKPLIAAINGPAAGAGFSMALSADIAIASPSAHFTAAYTGIGLSPDGGMTHFLPRLIGLSAARDLILTNRRCNVEEARSLGIISRVAQEGQFDQEVSKLVAQLVRGPVEAFGKAKTLLNRSFSETFETQKALEMRAIAEAAGGPEFREGLSAFNAKRKPNFEGLKNA